MLTLTIKIAILLGKYFGTAAVQLRHFSTRAEISHTDYMPVIHAVLLVEHRRI
jgi:hypothetical protein